MRPEQLAKRDVEITLVDRRNHHLFSPLLYQVATGALTPSDIAQPLRLILRKQQNVRVLLAEAMSLDPGAKTVRIDDGTDLEYDSLIVATGTKHSYFGNDAVVRVRPGHQDARRRAADARPHPRRLRERGTRDGLGQATRLDDLRHRRRRTHRRGACRLSL